MRQAWEVARWHGAVTISPHVKSSENIMQKLPLPWDSNAAPTEDISIEERKERAAEIEKARDEYLAARDKYNTLVNNFCRDFGSYHYSIKSANDASDLYNAFLSMF